VIGCPNTNAFLQCTGTACARQQCPSGQVWNFLKNACSACDTGKHVSASLQTCVCDQGKTLDSATGNCVDCPTASTQEVDRCFCPSNLARDFTNNACKACPAEAPIGRENKCVCTSTTLFFDPTSWTCKACPGTVVPPRRGNGRSSCRCTGANQIFYQKTFSCYTCPTGTTASIGDCDGCQCPRYTGQKFDYVSGTCKCNLGFTLNTTTGVCTRNTTPLNP